MDLKPFTAVATTSKPWRFPASFRRWFVAMDFAPYDREDVARILLQLATDEGLKMDFEAALLMAGHCHSTPGNALALLKRIKRHHGSLISGAQIGQEEARRLLDFLG